MIAHQSAQAWQAIAPHLAALGPAAIAAALIIPAAFAATAIWSAIR